VAVVNGDLGAGAGAPALDPAARLACRDELSPLTFLRRAAQVHGNRVAAEEGGVEVTWAALAERAERMARALRAAGVEEHDRVCVLAPNTLDLLVAHFGVPQAGAVLCAINTRLGEEEIAYIVGHSQARVLIVHPDLEGVAQAAVREHGPQVWVLGTDLDARLAHVDEGLELPRWPDDENAPISVNYTSGTTGRPKGVVYTHRGAYLMALGEALESRITIDSRYLWTLPMFHCNGWCYPWAVTAVAARHVLIPKVDPSEVWRRLGEGVTHLCGAPTVLISLAAHPHAAPLAERATMVVGGAPPSPSLLARMEDLNVEVVHVYGLTETYGPSTVCDWPAERAALDASDRAALKARQGVPFKVAGEVRVVDRDMNDVPPDGSTLGEVVFRGNSVMAGYLDDPEATAEAYRGGWFHSGDAAVMHAGGEIELRDRFKDVIISGGENISSIEVEHVLMRHPAVLEAAVVAAPHETWGERPKAFVTLVDGASADPAELIAFTRERLAHFKAPDEIVFGPLPKTATGKVRKNVLRATEPAADGARSS
jgi:fatty-acyl-CoA synthase